MSWLGYLVVSLLVYIPGWALTARHMYRRKRIYEVGKPHCDQDRHGGYLDSCGVCVSDRRRVSNDLMAQDSAWEAVFWPFTIIPRTIVSFAKRNPTLAPKEVEQVRREQQATTARLDKELEASKGEISDAAS